MTAVVENARYRAVFGDLKFILIQTDAAAATSATIDLDSDKSDGRGTEIQEILLTLIQDDAGADKDATWVPGTGIITLGTISTGIHNILIIGR